MYVFGRFEYYDSYTPAPEQAKYEFTSKKNLSFGLNYYPLPQIGVKADYTHRFLKSQYNDEPSLNIGIAYEGFFL